MALAEARRGPVQVFTSGFSIRWTTTTLRFVPA